MSKPLGVVLYEGPSVLDGKPIVAIATFNSGNKKTGQMIQTWILRQDRTPVLATKTGADESVCGSCPHRHYLGGACYVNVGRAPQGVWKTWNAGKYPLVTDEHWKYFEGREVRLGAYGDPAAVPVSVWIPVVNAAKGHTGYTHQMSHPNFDPAILAYCMASADTPSQAAKMRKQGARTFRVKTEDAPLMPGEIECLFYDKGLTCRECMLCDGAAKGGVSIAVTVHGSLRKRYETKYAKANDKVIALDDLPELA